MCVGDVGFARMCVGDVGFARMRVGDAGLVRTTFALLPSGDAGVVRRPQGQSCAGRQRPAPEARRQTGTALVR